MKTVINRGKRSSEVKPVKNTNKNHHSFLKTIPLQNEVVPPSHQQTYHAYE